MWGVSGLGGRSSVVVRMVSLAFPSEACPGAFERKEGEMCFAVVQRSIRTNLWRLQTNKSGESHRDQDPTFH